MPVFIACPSCGVKLSVPEEMLGRAVRCASCKMVFEAHEDPQPQRPTPYVPPSHYDSPEPDETEPKRRRSEYDDHDDYDDDDYAPDDRRSRYRRRDVAPHRGGLLLGLGIASVIASLPTCCCPLTLVVGIPLGAVSWILAHGDLQQMKKGTMDDDGHGMTQAGYVLGIIGVVLGIVGMVWFVFSLVLNVGFANGGKGLFGR